MDKNVHYCDLEGIPQIEKHKVEMAASGIIQIDEKEDRELIAALADLGW